MQLHKLVYTCKIKEYMDKVKRQLVQFVNEMVLHMLFIDVQMKKY